MEQELRMYIVVNSSVSMGKGKIAAQVGHVVSSVTETMAKVFKLDWKEYKNNAHPKIVLKAPEDVLVQLKETYSSKLQKVWCEGVHDVGRTQVPAGTLTAIAFRPLRDADVPKEIKELKLL